MANIEEGKAAKARGNAAFSAKDYETAVKEFTAAIGHNPNDHVFYSNRSGSYANLGKYEEALADAEKCISVKPDWAKGYSRKGLAALALKKFPDAKEAYSAGLKIDGNNVQCQQGLKDTEEQEKSAANPMASLFGDGMWAKLHADPTTREHLKDPAFVQKLKMMQSNPNAFGSMASDPKMSAALGVILGLGSSGFSSMGAGDEDKDAPMGQAPPTSAPKKEEVFEEEAEEVDLELELEKKQKADAVAEKVAGNALYKKRKFDEALVHYNKAIELDPDNFSFQANKAAVYFEQKDYDLCISTCENVIKESKASKCYDYKLVAKAYHRMANALEKAGKPLEEVIAAHGDALMEHPLPAAKEAIKKLKEKKKKADAEAYLSNDLSDEHKKKGNAFFQAQKWTDAIDEYTEGLKRNPDNHFIYSNRAACYTKLMDWNSGLKDVDRCLSIDPTFVKAYIRKGKIQHFLKQYHKALETYQKGLDLSPTSTELIEGKRATMNAINQENSSGNVDPARAKEAMKDPEIRGILNDPMINKVLKDMQEDPAAGQRAMADPVIWGKIEKLINAGILQVGNK